LTRAVESALARALLDHTRRCCASHWRFSF